MLTRDDIVYFYDCYKKNIDEETSLVEAYINIKSEKEWLDTIYERRERLATLYHENKQLVEKYLMPYLNGDYELNYEIAKEFQTQVYKFCVQTYSDELAGVDVSRLVSRYFVQNGSKEEIILAFHTQAVLTMSSCAAEDVREALELFSKILEYKDEYFEIDNWEIRRIIILAFYNRSAALGNYIRLLPQDSEKQLEYQREILKNTREAIEFLNSKKLRDYEKQDEFLATVINEMIFGVCANMVARISTDDVVDKEFIEFTTEKLVKVYNDEIKVKSEKEISVRVFCYYLICKYRNNEISIEELVDRYYEYCKYIVENKKVKVEPGFMMTEYCQVCIKCFPILLKYLDNEKIDVKKRDEITMYCIYTFFDLLSNMPHFKSSDIATELIEDCAFELIQYLPEGISAYYFLLRVILNRDINNVLHATMVRRLSNLILNGILTESPELLIGLLDTTNVIEVLEKQDEIVDFVRQACIIFDIGKIKYSDLINKAARDLTSIEKEKIKLHPVDGYNMIKNLEGMERYTDIVLGHHKDYDGNGGYPEEFDNTKSKVRFLIDLVKICDDMDVISDAFVYNNIAKSEFSSVVEEFKAGAGTKYNPDIIRIIFSNEKLKEDIYRCAIVERDKVYYETYYEFFNENTNEEEQPGLTMPQNGGNAKSSSHSFGIDIYKDTIVSIIYGEKCIINEHISDSFKAFVKNRLMPITHPDDVNKLKILLNYGGLVDKLNIGNDSYEMEIRLDDHGEWHWVRLHFLVVEQKYNIPQKILLAINDADQACKKREQLIKALEKAREDAKNANSAKSMFISNISHEIRTPMNAIVGMVEIMLRDEMTEQQKGYLVNIRNSGNALLSIINDILDFSKMESGKLEIIEDEYEMMSLLSDLGMIFLNRIGEKPVELIFDVDKNIPELFYGDVVRIRQIIINIMNNAIKFTDEGMVRLKIGINSLIDDEMELAISVKDTGIGIKEEELPKLFGAFQQVDIKRNRQLEGTGLGLVISKQLIELMGGSISVNSVYGEGTEFRFTIKQKVLSKKKAVTIGLNEQERKQLVIGGFFENKFLENAMKELCEGYELCYINLKENESKRADYIFADGVNAGIVKQQFASENTRICIIQNPMMEGIKESDVRIVNKPLYCINFCQIINNEDDKVNNVRTDEFLDFIAPDAKILIVDDTEMNLTVAKGLLQPIKMQIDTADNGKTAIDMIQKKEYDLVFMDHKMPVMDGIEATQLIRKIQGEYYQNVPIIALTANAVMDARESFSKAGMNDFVAKPIEMKAICCKIKKWLPKELILKRTENDNINVDDISLPAIKGIDVKEGIKNSGNVELFTTLLCDYYKLIDVKSEKIAKLFEEKNIHDFTIEVHALKSTSRMIGALQLSEKFKQLEEWGDANNIEDISKELSGVLKQFSTYKEYLKDFVLHRELENGIVKKESISNAELVEVFETICMAMQGCDLDMLDECMNRLEICEIPDSISTNMDKLKLLVADFDMEGIVAVSNEIIKILK